MAETDPDTGLDLSEVCCIPHTSHLQPLHCASIHAFMFLLRCLEHRPAIVFSTASSAGFRCIGGNGADPPTEAADPGPVLADAA